MTPPSSPRAGEPRTEAGRRLWDSAHGLTRLDKAVTRDKARDLIREEVLRIEAEARAGEAEGGVRPDDDAVWAHVIREHETGEPALLDDEGVAAVNKALSVYGSRTFLDRTWIRPGPTLAALASPEPAGDEK
jgi:hypothetical protein